MNDTLEKKVFFASWLLPVISKQKLLDGYVKQLSEMFWLHLLWTLWFWIPFGPIFGWIHLSLKSFRLKYVFYALLYSVVLLFPFSQGFWFVNIIAWFVGLIHCYTKFNETFLYSLESINGKHYKSSKNEDGKYNLNTIDYRSFVKDVRYGENIALPILLDRHRKGQYGKMDVFFGRLDWVEKYTSWKQAVLDNFYVNDDL